MIPTIWRFQHTAGTVEGTPEHRGALLRATKESSAAVGIIGAAGAVGGFLIPMMFGAPWITDPLAAVKTAFVLFISYYVLCALVTWTVYIRRGSPLAEARA